MLVSNGDGTILGQIDRDSILSVIHGSGSHTSDGRTSGNHISGDPTSGNNGAAFPAPGGRDNEAVPNKEVPGKKVASKEAVV